MTITTADALKVMALISVHHRRTAPRMDGREVALMTATEWADQFNAYKLTLDDLLNGIRLRARTNVEAPETAEIIAAARDIRRDRMDRESIAERQAREDAWDAEIMAQNREKLAELMRPMTDRKGAGECLSKRNGIGMLTGLASVRQSSASTPSASVTRPIWPLMPPTKTRQVRPTPITRRPSTPN